MDGHDVCIDRLLQKLGLLEKEMTYYNRLLYENPELPLQEYRASKELAAWLESYGFKVDWPLVNLPTAFVAAYKNGSGGAVVGFLAEYDALPVVGHGCGHNIIGSSYAGAAIGLAQWLAEAGIPGEVIVYGCPDEEFDGGKVLMVEAGLFDRKQNRGRVLDDVLQIHPGTVNGLWGWSPSATTMLMKFHGKAAHTASEPEKGISALSALRVAFCAMDALRHHVKDGTRFPATIVDGGGAPNAVPEYAEARIHLTAAEREYLEEVVEKVKNCGRGGALATGAQVEFWDGPVYENMILNEALGAVMEQYFTRLGLPVDPPAPVIGATDAGNVSMVAPPARQLSPSPVRR